MSKVDRENLIKWLASYSGCDGGCPEKSSIWFTGIEWGFGKRRGQSNKEHESSVKDYHNGEMLSSMKSGYSKPYSDKYSLINNMGYTFGKRSAKLLSVINGYSIADYMSAASKTSDTDVFKLNLHPISLPDTNITLWNKYELDKLTGLKRKQDYIDLCRQHRYPFFRDEAIKHKPKLILCVGKEYAPHYAKCFCDIDELEQLTKEEIVDTSAKNNNPRAIFWKKITDDTLFVTVPFLVNRYGLNSNYLIDKFGQRIKELLV